jgi:hypothetical protein
MLLARGINQQQRALVSVDGSYGSIQMQLDPRVAQERFNDLQLV